ncbi:MAG: glycoside hydrolase family 31 protein [Candidatus Eisenbacteria bacterium]
MPAWARSLHAVLALFGATAAHADPLAESLGEGVVRWWADAASRDAAPPSVIVTGAPAAQSLARGTGPAPRFLVKDGGRIVRLDVPRGTTLHGTGEVGGPLVRNGRQVTCWNTDAYAYSATSPSLYQSHPWVLAVRPDGSSFGVLADTPEKIVVDLTRGIEFRALGAPFPVLVIERANPLAVLAELAALTGHMPLPPRWAIGFQQCRYSYAPAAEVERIAREFRARALPCDVLWMDIDYMDRRKPFTFDPRGFAHPAALSDTLHARGFRTVWILDPGIKQEPGDLVYEQGRGGDHWVKLPDGAPYTGRVWPGTCVFPDFTRRATREWWGGLTARFAERAGADGIWNDMNEPAVFDVEGKTLPQVARHDADAELGGPGWHSRYHNLYGQQMARATFEGLRAARPDKRPFVLSRANLLGGQRFAAAWTGDNRANDEHLHMTLPMILNLGLSGQPFSGPDIGGYAGPCTGDDYLRWLGLGALLPFARAHTETGNIRKEPWSFGPQIEAQARRALETRYRLLPYLYTCFEEASRTGAPIVRPAFFADLTRTELRSVEHEFLIGADVCARLAWAEPLPDSPSVLQGGNRWPRVTVVPGDASELLPTLHVRAGAIVPLGPVMQYSDERPLDDVELLVAPDANGHAEGVLYEDAGDGYGYARGEYRRWRFVATTDAGVVHVKIASADGAWQPPASRRWRVTLVGTAKGVRSEGP